MALTDENLCINFSTSLFIVIEQNMDRVIPSNREQGVVYLMLYDALN